MTPYFFNLVDVVYLTPNILHCYCKYIFGYICAICCVVVIYRITTERHRLAEQTFARPDQDSNLDCKHTPMRY